MLAPQLRTTRAVDEILVRTHRGRKRVIYRLSPRTAGAKGTYLSSLAERTLFTTPAEQSANRDERSERPFDVTNRHTHTPQSERIGVWCSATKHIVDHVKCALFYKHIHLSMRSIHDITFTIHGIVDKQAVRNANLATHQEYVLSSNDS